MWMFTVCQSLQVIADNCADIAATMNEFSLSSWTGNGSEGARAEIDQIAKGSNSWSALASQLKELAQFARWDDPRLEDSQVWRGGRPLLLTWRAPQ